MMTLLLGALLLFSHSVLHSKKPASHIPFYRITKAGSADTSYLFGTLHLLEASYVDTMPRVMHALGGADMVVGELEMDSVAHGFTIQSLMAQTPLDSVLTPSQFELVTKAVEKYSPVPIMMLNLAEPVVVYTIVMEGMYEQAHPENHKTGVPMDLYFQQYAKNHGKRVMGLEEASDQAQALDSIPQDEQVLSLMELVRDPKGAVKELNKMLAEYRAGKISEILDDPEFGSLSPDDMKSLLTVRNQKWLAELPKILDSHRAFIAVGAGHLAGKVGLVEGLKKLGYKVEAVKS
ncbi:MAG TPA: TraB/GumN family protein [Candidatus Kapabacteria bacterium]